MLIIFFQLLFFLILSVYFLYVPGLFFLCLTRLKYQTTENIFLSGVVGFIFTSLLIYLSLFINGFYLVVILITAINILYYKKYFPKKTSMKQFLQSIKIFLSKKYSKYLLFVFLIGVLGQLAVIAPSGTYLNGDLLFWSAHGHDGLWHVSLIEEIKKGALPQNPIYGGYKLLNYHFFSDLVPAFFSKYFGLSSLDLFFKFFPLLFSVWIGIGSFILGKKLTQGSTRAGLWATFFTYFSGSFGFIVTLYRDHRLSGETLFWSSQVQSSSGNPPQIVALTIVLAISLLLVKYIDSKDKPLLLINLLLIGTLVEFKVYGAIIVFLSLGMISLIRIVKDHKFDLFLLTLASSFIAALLFFPNSSNAGGFLIYEPGWFIRTMIVSSDKLNWLDLELRRQTYLYEQNYKRVFSIQVLGFLIFLFGNLGTKFLGLMFFIKLLTTFKNYPHQFLVLISFFALLLPLLFLQKGVAGNTIQFLQYFLLFLGIFSGIIVSILLKKIKNIFLKITFIIIIILFSIPTQIGLLIDFYSRPAFAKVPKSEIEALNFINNTSPNNSIILSPAFDKYINVQSSTLPIWAWSDTAYIPAISCKQNFVADIEQLDITGYDYNLRQDIQKKLFQEENSSIFKNLLKENQINLIYLTRIQQKPKVNLNLAGLTLVF